jgi:hypothetical protein
MVNAMMGATDEKAAEQNQAWLFHGGIVTARSNRHKLIRFPSALIQLIVSSIAIAGAREFRTELLKTCCLPGVATRLLVLATAKGAKSIGISEP